MAIVRQHPQPLVRTPIELACLPDEAVITAQEAAVLLGCPLVTLERWRRDRLGPDYLPADAPSGSADYQIGVVRHWMASPAVGAGSSGTAEEVSV